MLRCIRCGHDYEEIVSQCEDCGWKFDNVSKDELPAWFAEVQHVLESAYLTGPTPWKQSGKGGDYGDWKDGRGCIAAAIDSAGSFLDIGCANGYLLECLMEWSEFEIEPFGLDVSASLIDLAKERLHTYTNNLFVGNGFDWQPPQRFDYVRTEMVYVPKNWEEHYIRRLRRDFLTPNGKLLVAEYTTSQRDHIGPWVDEVLTDRGLPVAATFSGTATNGREIARVAVVPTELER